MGNYSGREFDPDFDRTDVDILCISGKSDIVQKPVDPADPYRSSHIGIFERCIETGDKKETYAVYIPEDFPPFGDGIFVFAPGKISAEDYIQHSGIRKNGG